MFQRISAGAFNLTKGQKNNKNVVLAPLMANTNGQQNAGRFLRRPLPPKVEPKLPPTPPIHTDPSRSLLSGEFLVEPEFYYEDGNYPPRPPDTYTFERSGTSPPPPSEFNSSTRKLKSETGSTSLQKSTRTRQSAATHSVHKSGSYGRYVLDPIYREQTNIGTYVEGKSLVQPFKPRGPDALPARIPVKRQAPPFEFEEDERYEEEEPQFTLQDFLVEVSQENNVPLVKVKEIMYSKHNFKKIQEMIAENLEPSHTTLTKVTMKPSGEICSQK